MCNRETRQNRFKVGTHFKLVDQGVQITAAIMRSVTGSGTRVNTESVISLSQVTHMKHRVKRTKEITGAVVH